MTSSRKHDSAKPSRLNRVLRIASLAVFLGIGLAIGFLLPTSQPAGPNVRFPGKITLWQVVLIPIAILLLTVIVHELGHLIAGLLARFRFVLLAVGPVKLYADGPRLRLGLNHRLAFGGMTICVPRHTRQLGRRVAGMILAGPCANLGLSALIGFVFLLQPRLDLAGALFLQGLAFLSGIMGLLNLFPIHSKGFTSDGRRAWDLLRGTPEAQRWLALWTLLATAIGGTRPADQDPDLITRAMALPDDSVDHLSALMWAYYAALDQGQWDEARFWLDEIQDRVNALPEAVRAAYLIEIAYFVAAIDHDAARARALLAEAKHPLLVSASTRARAEAALLLAEGQPGPAIQRAQEALAALAAEQTPGMMRAERDWVQALIAAAREAVV
jgi:hypothetical protein